MASFQAGALADRPLSEPILDQWRDMIQLAVAVPELGADRYDAALGAVLDARACGRCRPPRM